MLTLIFLLEIALDLFTLYWYTFNFNENKGAFLVYYKIVIDKTSGLKI